MLTSHQHHHRCINLAPPAKMSLKRPRSCAVSSVKFLIVAIAVINSWSPYSYSVQGKQLFLFNPFAWRQTTSETNGRRVNALARLFCFVSVQLSKSWQLGVSCKGKRVEYPAGSVSNGERIYDHFAPIIDDKSLFKQKRKKEVGGGVSGISLQDAVLLYKMCFVTIMIINGRSSFLGAEGIVNNKIWNKKKKEEGRRRSGLLCCTLCRNQWSDQETPFASPPAAASHAVSKDARKATIRLTQHVSNTKNPTPTASWLPSKKRKKNISALISSSDRQFSWR